MPLRVYFFSFVSELFYDTNETRNIFLMCNKTICKDYKGLWLNGVINFVNDSLKIIKQENIMKREKNVEHIDIYYVTFLLLQKAKKNDYINKMCSKCFII